MSTTEPRQDPVGAARAAEIAAADEDWDQLEQAGLLILSLARKHRAEGDS